MKPDQAMVTLTSGEKLPDQVPVPLLVLAAVLPLQPPPVSVPFIVAVTLQSCVVFVKSHVPTGLALCVAPPMYEIEHLTEGTVIVHVKAVSMFMAPVPEGEMNAVIGHVIWAVTSQVTVEASPLVTQFL